jgi:hypothetical protein
MTDHGLAEVTYEEFKSLMERIDREVVARHTSIELAHLTRALFDFLESGKMAPQVEFEQQTLPIHAAIIFYGDKNLMDICTRLEYERDQHGAMHMTVGRLADVIEIVRTGNEEARAHPPETQAALSEVQQRAEEQISAGEAGQFGAGQALSDMSQEPENSQEQKTNVLVFGENDEKYLASMPSAKQKEILDLFPAEEFTAIVRTLFSNDEPAFRGAITEISLLRTWEQVAQYLDKLYLANQIDPFSADAVGFTDKLYTHFHTSSTDA